MSTINTNVSSLLAQNALAQSNTALNTSLERLSTGLQINTGADNPSGLIAVQNFNQENTGLTTALNNASQAGNVVGTAEGGLSEVSDLLTQLQGLVGQAANTGGLTSDEVATILSMRPSAVRMAQMRALEKLRSLMAEVSVNG